jgi:hypothetical protein
VANQLNVRRIARKARAVSCATRALRVALLLGSLGGSVGATAAMLAGCPSSPTTATYTPITGIVIASSDLVAGHGCGTGPDQVYKYVAVLAQAATPSVPYTSLVVPCDSNAQFSNLASDSGDFEYRIYIFAYNFASFPPSLLCTPGHFDGGGCPGDVPSATAAAGNTQDAAITPIFPPNWTTQCTAIEPAGVSEVATCAPLEPTDAGSSPASITVSSLSFQVAGGGDILACPQNYQTMGATLSIIDGGAPPDAAPDAGPDVSADAIADANPESGTVGPSPIPTVSCPSPLVISPAVPNVTYAIDIVLGAGDGGAVAHTTCTATTVPGFDTDAVCAPVELAP